MPDLRDTLLKLSLVGFNEPEMTVLWRKKVENEVRVELCNHRNANNFNSLVAKAIMLIEEDGCSVAIAVKAALNPDDFYWTNKKRTLRVI